MADELENKAVESTEVIEEPKVVEEASKEFDINRFIAGNDKDI